MTWLQLRPYGSLWKEIQETMTDQARFTKQAKVHRKSGKSPNYVQVYYWC